MGTRGPVMYDEQGAYLVVGLERVEDVRAALSLAGIEFREGDMDDCGCGGPSAGVFRLEEPLDHGGLKEVLEGAGL